MIIMDGTGEHEQEFAKSDWAQLHCKGFEVVYNCKQETATQLSKQFLSFFDEEVRRAQTHHYGLAFRCSKGSHRTGRLSEYYMAKNKGLTDPYEAQRSQRLHTSSDITTRQLYHKTMDAQIPALIKYAHNESCDPAQMSCVTEEKDHQG
jgi:non-ribosomal peptide synthetase component F